MPSLCVLLSSSPKQSHEMIEHICVAMLLDAGADPNVRAGDRTPLMWLCSLTCSEAWRVRLLRLLVERGAPLVAKFTENLVPGKTYQVIFS